MEHDFYRGRLKARHGIDVIVPDDDDRTVIHDVIYEELILGVSAGCTEIEQLVTADDVAVPYFPTTHLHAEAAVEWAFS
jgi:aspartate racemase